MGPGGGTGGMGPEGGTEDMGPEGGTADMGPEGGTAGMGPEGGTADMGPEGGTGGAAGAGTLITVGIFRRTGDESYVQAPVNPFVFEVGVPCQSWSRRVTMPSPMDSIQEEHDHFNAADEVTYDGTTITWLEHGPEHSQEEIDATCAAGVDGALKTANGTDYTFDGNMGMMNDEGEWIGFYLKIISVD